MATLAVTMLLWAIWGKYCPKVMYGSVTFIAAVLYIWSMVNVFTSVLYGFYLDERTVFEKFIEAAVFTAYISLLYSVIAGLVGLVRLFLHRSTKKLFIIIAVVAVVSGLILLADQLLPCEYSTKTCFHPGFDIPL